jgi:hypothetical protein
VEHVRNQVRETVLGGIAGCATLIALASKGGGTSSSFVNVSIFAEFTLAELRLILIPIGFTLLSLLVIRRWPALLVAGMLCVLPSVLRHAFPDSDFLRLSTMAPIYLNEAGRVMVLLGTLGAAQQLILFGRIRAGAMVAGGAFGAQLFAWSFVRGPSGQVHGWLMSPLPRLELGLVLIGLVGTAPALVALWRKSSAARDADADSTAGRPPDVGQPANIMVAAWRRLPERQVLVAIIAGVAASAVGLVAILLPRSRTASLLDLLGLSSAPTRPVTTGTVGAVVVLATLGIVAILGWRVLLAVVTAALAIIAVPAVQMLAAQAIWVRDQFIVGVAALAVAVGVAAVVSRYRIVLAVTGGVASAGLLSFIVATSDGAPEEWPLKHSIALAAVVLGTVTATVVATIGTVAITVGRLGVLPAALGPMLGALELGGIWVSSIRLRDPKLDSNAWRLAHNTDLSMVLLLTAVTLLAAAGLIELWQRGKRQAVASPPLDLASQPVTKEFTGQAN